MHVVVLLLALAGCGPAPGIALAPTASTAPAASPTPHIVVTLTPLSSPSDRPPAPPTLVPTLLPTATPTAAPTPTVDPTPTIDQVDPTPTLDRADRTPTAEPTAVPTEVVPLPTPTIGPLDQAQRIKLFDEVWNTINDHYLYSDFHGTDWAAIKTTYRAQALDAPSSAAFYAALSAMVEQLDDQHSRFENPQKAFEQQARATGRDAYVGVGVLTVADPRGLLITTVFPNSPAAEAQIGRRDLIVAVDGAPINRDDPQINGPADTSVTLTVRSPDGAERDVRLLRRAVVAQYVPEAYVLPGTRVGYLLIQSFWAQDMADRTNTALTHLLDEHGPLDGLVIDIRSNGGGWRTVLEGLLQSYVAGDVGAWYSQEQQYPLTIAAGPLYERLRTVPITVLVDQDTASYAEVFAAVLQSSRHAKVIGTRTAGNTETIFAYDFEDQSRLWVAQEGFKLPDGANLEGQGVQPDREIDVDWTRYSEARDPQIGAALALIGQGQAGRK